MQCNNITTEGASSINIAINNISTKALRASCNTTKATWQALSNQQQSNLNARKHSHTTLPRE
nr:hypothetical protein [Tanacetum cinerariifolium]